MSKSMSWILQEIFFLFIEGQAQLAVASLIS
jgi:hypothetical protein